MISTMLVLIFLFIMALCAEQSKTNRLLEEQNKNLKETLNELIKGRK